MPAPPQNSSAPRRRICVLLVEDNPADAALIVEHLRDTGFEPEVRQVESAAQFDAALKTPCDVVLADYSLPQFGARAALRELRARRLDWPVIVVSGSVSEEAIVDCIHQGAIDYVLKDRLARLGHAVARALEHRERQERERAFLEELRESERQHRALFEQHPEPMWVFDLETYRILAVNRAAIAHYGYTREEFLARTIFDLRPPEDAAKLVGHLAQQPGNLAAAGVWKHQKKDGAEILAEITSSDIAFAGRKARLVMIKDITEARRAERQQRLQAALLEVAANPVIVTDASGTISWVNPAFTTLTGYTLAEAVGQTPRILKSGRHTDAFYREVWATILAGHVWQGEIVNRRKDGTLFHDAHTITPVRGEEGAITQFIAVMHDLTERKEAERELQATHAQLRRLLEHSPAILYSLRLSDALPEPVFVSDNITQLLGWRPSEVLRGDWWLPHVHPDDRDRALASEARARLAGVSSEEYRLRTKEGNYRWIEDSKRVLRDLAGRPLELVGVWTDIDARHRADEARRASEERFATIFRSSPVAIAYSTPDGKKLIEANEHYLEFFGYARAELVGRPGAEVNLWADAAQREELLRELARAGRLRNVEVRFARKTGEPRVGLVAAEALQVGGEAVFVWMIADITERKRLEAELFRALRVESIGRLASGIAHDMNNILAPIMMSAPLLRMSLSPADRESTLSTIELSANRGAELVRQLLIFSRGVEGERGPVRPKALIEELTKIARETFPRNIEILVECPRDIWPVRGDGTQLHQVLLNLCVNARDAMPAGGTLVIAAENVEADAESLRRQAEAPPRPHVVLRVSDTGIGIPPEIADRIFEPFFTTKEEGKGTGLGLSTVHGIVKSHGGFVRLKSELGRGTSFEIYLPAMHEAEPAAPVAASRVAVPRGQQELILVVDDEENIRRVLRQTLERHGYRVVTANDGAEGSVAFAQHRDEIKLVITDVDMPFMSGPNLIRAVRQMNPQVKFILSSGLSSGTLLHEELAELEPFEIRTLLRKPYTAEKILSAVERELKGEAADPERG